MDQAQFDSVVQELQDARDSKGNSLKMCSLMVSQGERRYAHTFGPGEPVDIRSIAKPIVCLALGAAIDRGLLLDGVRLGLDTPLWPLLSRYVRPDSSANIAAWSKVLLLDCLRITLGHDKGLMFSADVKGRGEADLIEYVVNYPITREVGKDFVYSNAGTFVVSTLITEYLGVDLGEWVQELLFEPLGIRVPSWKRYGKYSAGCTGVAMSNHDLHRIGRLIADGGVFEGTQLVPRQWIEQMRTPHVLAPTHRFIADRAFPKWSYGMNLWICENGNYYCDGTDGQYMIVIPSKDIVITTLAHQADTEPISKALGALR